MFTVAQRLIRRIAPFAFVVDDDGANFLIIIDDMDGIARLAFLPINEGVESSVTSPDLSGPLIEPSSSTALPMLGFFGGGLAIAFILVQFGQRQTQRQHLPPQAQTT